ncbi:hypothetical protein J0X19_08170 [Hymenobacter sp. BT186]|uniref:Uncharacterized protein n=1 Tax=Hymenobacter telluris TaxID=2816474 RepID=A0A939EVD0_9BACT|nr:hypothetical protein [Hymenobacter telluris]MBW3373943.1 hypothetical protein [Hymenobacter norwichensis]
MQVDTEQSLEQIENEYWDEPTYDSYLVNTCHGLRKKPLQDFTVEDLRIMIGQNISLDILIPIAFDQLKQNIMAEGNFYPGDLLQNILRVDRSYWLRNPIIHRRLNKLYRNNFPSIEKRVGKSITKTVFKEIIDSFEKFNRLNVS